MVTPALYEGCPSLLMLALVLAFNFELRPLFVMNFELRPLFVIVMAGRLFPVDFNSMSQFVNHMESIDPRILEFSKLL